MWRVERKDLAFSWGRTITGAMALVAVGVGLAGCDGVGPFEPEPWDRVWVPGQVRVTLDVVPDRLRPPGEVVATLTYENLGNETIVLASRNMCISGAQVYRGEERVPFPATQYSCLTAVGYWDLEPGQPITVRWRLSVGGEEDGFHAPEGSYRFVADLNTHDFDLESTFVIE